MAYNSYKHKVQYYETDRMGITHHSNYIRWMEESRCDFMAQMGFSYERLEELGVVSPVTDIECSYKATTTFGDVIDIKASVKEFKGVRLIVEYVMTKEDGTVVFTALSKHCFLSKEGTLIRLKNQVPELYDKFVAAAEECNQ